MPISETKMKIVIDNYYRSECDINTSIRQAFEKGFRVGVKKGLNARPEQKTCEGCIHDGKWEPYVEYGYPSPCTKCKRRALDNYEEDKE